MSRRLVRPRTNNNESPHLAPRGAVPIVLDASLPITPARPTRKSWFGTPSSVASAPIVPSTPASSRQIVSPPAPMGPSASALAKQSPQIGYLEKLGTQVPAFKRRFFVLEPSTVLYYYLGPHDASPRGCVDLRGSWVEDGQTDAQFAICWEDGRRVVLEARSPDVRQEWMRALEQERLEVVQEQLQTSEAEKRKLEERIKELEKDLEQVKVLEQDRNEAIEDAMRQKAEFDKLDEALRLLTRHVMRNTKDVVPESASSTDASTDDETDVSLLDNVVEQEERLDVLNVPGTYYHALYNACEQLKENVQLASTEAADAVEDLNGAHENVQRLEKRMGRAEKQLAKFWQENCQIRQALKQTKREKRVLVREVKALQEKGVPEADDVDEVDADEEKLMEELESHVMSSIQLHEQFLAVSGTHVSRASISQADIAVKSAPISNDSSSDKERGKLVSLLDDDSEEDESEEEDLAKRHDLSLDESVDSLERPNPVDALDVDSEAESIRPEMTPILHNPTSKLVCPLADVSPGSTDLKIYHLTFYSRKIGLQFQRVPPPPPKGALTAALTLDADDAELQRIAAFSSWTSPMAKECPVATPRDAVLVCGVEGCEERPKLGARLVAFDGVSVEVGNWTFESIRQAIQARPRPLTLSFRNDFLTTQQRRILTKAIRKQTDAEDSVYSDSQASSSSVLSAVAPLVTNLLQKKDVTPAYLKRVPTPVQGTPQHQDFESELL